jgi:hypothetical protein
MFVCCVCCVLYSTHSDHCDELVTSSGNSYQLCVCLIVCHIGTSKMAQPGPSLAVELQKET